MSDELREETRVHLAAVGVGLDRLGDIARATEDEELRRFVERMRPEVASLLDRRPSTAKEVVKPPSPYAERLAARRREQELHPVEEADD